MIVLVCGGRAYADRARVYEALGGIESTRGSLIGLVHGASGKEDDKGRAICGADLLARDWQAERIRAERGNPRGLWSAGYPVTKEDWAKHGDAAGPIRNRYMLARHPNIGLVVAFPGGPGTAGMVKLAHHHNFEVVEITTAAQSPSPIYGRAG